MAREKELILKLDVQMGQFKAKTQEAQQSATKLGKSIKNTSQQARDSGGRFKGAGAGAAGAAVNFDQLSGSATTLGLRLAAAGAALSAIAFTSVNASREFEKALANVSTLVDTSAVSIEDLKTGILDLDNRLGGATENTEALYQALSAGVEPAAAVDFIRVSAELAAVGLTDTTTTVDALTSVLNSYGLEASEAARQSEILFEAVRQGKTTVDQLSNSVGTVTPIAAQAGVGFNEVSAALATLTKSGLSTDLAATQLRALLVSLIKPTDQSRAAFRRLGVDISLARLKSEGLGPVLEDIGKATGGNADQLAELFPNIRALGAASTLAGTQLEEYDRILNAVNDSQGNVTEGLEKQQATLDTSLNELGVALEKAKISVGDELAPAIASLAQSLTTLIVKFDSLSPGVKKAIAFLGLGGGAALGMAGVLLLIVGQVAAAVSAIGSLVAAMGGMAAISAAASSAGAALAAALGPALLVAAALAAGLAIGHLIGEMTGLNDIVDTTAASIAELDEVMDQFAKETALEKINKRLGTSFTDLDEALVAWRKEMKKGIDVREEAAAAAEREEQALEAVRQQVRTNATERLQAALDETKALNEVKVARENGLRLEVLALNTGLEEQRRARILAGQDAQELERMASFARLEIAREETEGRREIIDQQLAELEAALQEFGTLEAGASGEEVKLKADAEKQIQSLEKESSDLFFSLQDQRLEKARLINTQLVNLTQSRSALEQEAASALIARQQEVTEAFKTETEKLKSLLAADAQAGQEEAGFIGQLLGVDAIGPDVLDQVAQLRDALREVEGIQDPTEEKEALEALLAKREELLAQARQEAEQGADLTNLTQALFGVFDEGFDRLQDARQREIEAQEDQVNAAGDAADQFKLKFVEVTEAFDGHLDERLELEANAQTKSLEGWAAYWDNLIAGFRSVVAERAALLNAPGSPAGLGAQGTTAGGPAGSTVSVNVNAQVLGGGDLANEVNSTLLPAIEQSQDLSGDTTGEDDRNP
jgi:TP901 family phage tail tape measure protein